jgi:hypothetical protein
VSHRFASFGQSHGSTGSPARYNIGALAPSRRYPRALPRGHPVTRRTWLSVKPVTTICRRNKFGARIERFRHRDAVALVPIPLCGVATISSLSAFTYQYQKPSSPLEDRGPSSLAGFFRLAYLLFYETNFHTLA